MYVQICLLVYKLIYINLFIYLFPKLKQCPLLEIKAQVQFWLRFRRPFTTIFQKVLLPTYYELFSIGINLEPDCTDHINRHYL